MPVIGWTGAHKFASDYCYTVANGDIPTEGVMCANWLYQQGLKKVGLFWEVGSSGRDYADFFRDEAIRLGLTITREVKLEPNPRNLKEHLADMRDMGTEGVYYGGYGYATFHFAEAFRALDWDPPRVMGTAFMFYSNSNKWAEGLEGWHGVDQLGEDGTNPNYEAMVQALQGALRTRDAQRRRRARLRHRARGDPRHRQREDPDAARGARRARPHPLDAGDQRRPRHATCSSVPATTRATRATSSRSASCAAASSASTATTGPSGRRTRCSSATDRSGSMGRRARPSSTASSPTYPLAGHLARCRDPSTGLDRQPCIRGVAHRTIAAVEIDTVFRHRVR